VAYLRHVFLPKFYKHLFFLPRSLHVLRRGVQIMELFTTQNILLSALFPHTPSSSVDVRDQISHPYKTTGKIIVMYILRSEDEITNGPELSISKHFPSLTYSYFIH
jgi:hypothetical protein